MWSVLSKQAALFERFHDQSDVALFEVPDTAMHQFCASARRPFAEIMLLEEEHIVAAARGIDGDAHACGAAADDDQVPGIVSFLEADEHIGPAHATHLS